MASDKLSISALGKYINRRPATIRGWEREGVLPRPLRGSRSGPRGHRHWTRKQADGIREWMVEADMRPGKAFPHYQPTPDEVDKHIAKGRKIDLDDPEDDAALRIAQGLDAA